MLKNKIIFITGASSGIGAACAEYFAREGSRLLLCARRIELLNSQAELLRKKYKVDIHTLELDVRKNSEIQESIKTLPAAWQDIDVLLNNAGLAAGLASIQEGEVNDWDDMIDTNIKGLLYVTKAILPQMIKRNTGHIINIGSIAGHEVYPNGVVYCATKHSVNVLSQGLRLDLFGTKIRVSSVDPGMVNTNFSTVRFKGDEQRAADVYKGMVPLSAEDIADAVLYCATRPAHVNINDLFLMPTDQASATLVNRT